MTIVSYIYRFRKQDFNSGPFEHDVRILTTNLDVKPILRPDSSKYIVATCMYYLF
jgi:hypothetical protein